MTYANATNGKLADLETRSPIPGVVARRLMGEHVMIQDLDVSAGASAPMHSHENEQIMVLLSGRWQMTLQDAGAQETRVVTMEPGDVIHLPPNCPHGGEALEDCHILDIFSPPAEATGIDKT